MRNAQTGATSFLSSFLFVFYETIGTADQAERMVQKKRPLGSRQAAKGKRREGWCVSGVASVISSESWNPVLEIAFWTPVQVWGSQLLNVPGNESSIEICLSVAMASTAKWKYYPGQSWAHKRKAKREKFDAIRLRDGDNCWRCGHKMRFGGIPNIGKAATIEHLQPLSKGGTWAMENLALCHVGCNRHMKDFDRAHKEKMRCSAALPSSRSVDPTPQKYHF